MAANSVFQINTTRGWRMGLRNLLQKENGEWWRTRRWWIQLILWILIVNGVATFITFGLEQAAASIGEPISPLEVLQSAAQAMMGMASLGTAIGVIILTQDEIIAEKQSGTAAWVLSKPTSRTAFYLSKLFSNGLAVLVLMLIVPLSLGYLMFLVKGYEVSLANFAIACGIILVHTFFYLTLSLMMGVFAEKRGVILAGTLGALLGGQVLTGLVKFLVYVTPFGLPQMLPAIVVNGTSALPPELFIPVAVSFVWSLVFIALSLWKVNKLEF